MHTSVSLVASQHPHICSNTVCTAEATREPSELAEFAPAVFACHKQNFPSSSNFHGVTTLEKFDDLIFVAALTLHSKY